MCESSRSSQFWCICGLKSCPREPNFEHYLYLQQSLKVFLTVEKKRIQEQALKTMLKSNNNNIRNFDNIVNVRSYPISGFCRIPRILCNLSIATLCWKLVKPAINKIYVLSINVSMQISTLGLSTGWDAIKQGKG